MPLFSIIIAVYNDWTALKACLYSLHQQKDETDFEIIIVDDGSDETAPEEVRQWLRRLPLSIERQNHQGISAAHPHRLLRGRLIGRVRSLTLCLAYTPRHSTRPSVS